jgi:hypothetical protein
MPSRSRPTDEAGKYRSLESLKNEHGRDEWTATKYGHIQIDAASECFWLRIQEEGVRTRGPWEEEVQRYRYVRGDESWWRDREVPRSAYDADANGRLRIVLHAARYWALRGRQSRFGDRQSWALETRLPHLFREIEERIIELAAYDEAQRIKAEQQAEAVRRAAEERERKWQQLMAHAKERLLEDHLATHAVRQAEAWRKVREIREYCDGIEAVHGPSSTSAGWVDWMRSYAARIDPLAQPPASPAPPEETAEALQEYLPAGWSAEGPEHEIRRSYRPGW